MYITFNFELNNSKCIKPLFRINIFITNLCYRGLDAPWLWEAKSLKQLMGCQTAISEG